MRKLLLLICGTKDQYRQLRDKYTLETRIKVTSSRLLLPLLTIPLPPGLGEVHPGGVPHHCLQGLHPEQLPARPGQDQPESRGRCHQHQQVCRRRHTPVPAGQLLQDQENQDQHQCRCGRLKALDTGLLLVTGPFKLNGCPIRGSTSATLWSRPPRMMWPRSRSPTTSMTPTSPVRRRIRLGGSWMMK